MKRKINLNLKHDCKKGKPCGKKCIPMKAKCRDNQPIQNGRNPQQQSNRQMAGTARAAAVGATILGVNALNKKRKQDQVKKANQRNFYNTLEVDPKSLPKNRKERKQALNKQYKRLAKKYHPDLNPGNEEAAEKMRRLNIAMAESEKY